MEQEVMKRRGYGDGEMMGGASSHSDKLTSLSALLGLQIYDQSASLWHRRCSWNL